MPIVYGGDTAQFLEVCVVDEALDLLEWLRGQPHAKIDLESCTHLHSSLFQLILATRPKMVCPPDDPFLCRVLGDAAHTQSSAHIAEHEERGENQ